MQLTATFAVVLIVRDAALALWGAEDLLGPRAPGLAGTVAFFGHPVPQYDLFLILAAPAVLVALTLLVTRTRFGMLIRAAAENRTLTAALGIDQARLFTAVFALGAFLAGLAGALQLPREPANLGMDLVVIADAFVVTVVGGLGSIPGAFLAAALIGVTKTFCVALGNVDVFGIDVRVSQTYAGRRVHRHGDRPGVQAAGTARQRAGGAGHDAAAGTARAGRRRPAASRPPLRR